MGADVMMGTDPECRRWIKKYREPAAEGEGRGARGDRERRRRIKTHNLENILFIPSGSYEMAACQIMLINR